jgi:hypothetical protein
VPPLAATLELRKPPGAAPTDVLLEATVTNEGAEPVPFNPAQAAYPSLVLEVEGPSGQRVLLPPPPVPTEADAGPGEPLEPGAVVTLTYAGFLDPALGPGRFRARYAGRFPALGGSPDDPLTSEWVEFDLPRPPRGRRKLWPIPWSHFWRWLQAWTPSELFPIPFRCWLPRAWEVDQAVTQTITNAPPPFEAYNGTYGWRARFLLLVLGRTCRVHVQVRVRVIGTITQAQLNAWGAAIASAWGNIFKLCYPGFWEGCCRNGFTLVPIIAFVTTNEHQVVVAGANTVNMGNWGAADTVDVRHEFGHMLGALDEYFTVNGTAWGAPRQATGSIMNNPPNAPAARHYELLRTQTGAVQAIAVGQSC